MTINNQGIHVTGQNVRISGNHVVGNGQSAGCCTGIWLEGAANIAENNTTEGNPIYGIYAAGSGTIVTKNISRGDIHCSIFTAGSCTGCDIGPSGTASGATSPWANIMD